MHTAKDIKDLEVFFRTHLVPEGDLKVRFSTIGRARDFVKSQLYLVNLNPGSPFVEENYQNLLEVKEAIEQQKPEQ